MTNEDDRRDPRIEAKFNEWNITFRYEPAFPLDKIRVAEWAQVRDGVNISPPELADEYRLQMDAGAKFPPLVLYNDDTLGDGNTRKTAAKSLRIKTFPVYIGEFPSVAIAKAFCAALNNMGGQRLTADEAARAATELMDLEFADQAIARELAISVVKVRRIRSKTEFQARAARLEIADKADRVRDDDRVTLNAIKHNAPLVAAIDLVASVRPKASVVREMVKKIEAAASDDEALEVIAATKAELQPAGPPPHRATIPPEVRQASMHLGGLIKLGANPILMLEMRPEERDATIAKWRQLQELIPRVLDLYGVSPALAGAAA